MSIKTVSIFFWEYIKSNIASCALGVGTKRLSIYNSLSKCASIYPTLMHPLYNIQSRPHLQRCSTRSCASQCETANPANSPFGKI